MSNGNEDLEAFIQQNNLPLSLKNTLLSETTKLQVRIYIDLRIRFNLFILMTISSQNRNILTQNKGSFVINSTQKSWRKIL